MNEMENFAEERRIEAGNEIMNYITDYYLEQQELYREEHGVNYIEAMRQDKIWNLEGDEKFQSLLKEYFELTVGD